MAAEPKVTLTVRLTPDTYDQLRAAAKARDLSINAYIANAITAMLTQENPR